MATLTKQDIAPGGEALTFAAAAAADEVAHEPGLVLVAWNDGGAASKTVTVVSQLAAGVGVAAANTTQAVAIDEIAMIPIGDRLYKDGSGMVQFSVDVEAAMKYAIIRL